MKNCREMDEEEGYPHLKRQRELPPIEYSYFEGEQFPSTVELTDDSALAQIFCEDMALRCDGYTPLVRTSLICREMSLTIWERSPFRDRSPYLYVVEGGHKNKSVIGFRDLWNFLDWMAKLNISLPDS